MGLSTHILDTALGRPAANAPLLLDKLVAGRWVQTGSGLTDPDAQAQPNAANGSAAKPGQTPANPAAPATPAPAKVLHPAHPDRFSPGGAAPDSPSQPKAAKPPAPPQRNP